MYEPWKIVRKEGFANFESCYTMFKFHGIFENQLYPRIFEELQDKYDAIVLACFIQKGFSEPYIREHIDEFHTEVSRSGFCSSCGYFYKDDLLFIITTDYKFINNCDIPNKEECTIGFRIEMQ